VDLVDGEKGRQTTTRQQEVKGPKATNAHLDGSAFKKGGDKGRFGAFEGGVAEPRMFDDECTR